VFSVELIRHRQESPHQADDDVVPGIAGSLAHERHLDRRHDEQRAEDRQHPRKLRDQPGADRDHGAAHHQGAENAPEQHAMLVEPGNGEVGEQHRDHEHVVGAQRQLDDVTGEELQHRRSRIVHRPSG
jgi:hypothetical protein